MGRDFDLFGRPLPRNLGQPGRNEHVPTPENANKIRAFLIARWTVAEIAKELGVSAPTIRKHYFRDLAQGREAAIREVKGKVLVQLIEQADEGKVPAMKELLKIVQVEGVNRLPKGKPEARRAVAPKLGKKEAREQAANKPKGGWFDRLEKPTDSGPH